MEKEYAVEVASPYKAQMGEVAIEVTPTCEDQYGNYSPSETKTVVIDPDDKADSSERRKVIRAFIVNHHDGSPRRVNMTIAAQRRKRKEEWKDAAEFNLTQLKGGEEASIYFDAAETWEVYESLRDLYAISQAGEPSGERNVYVVQRGATERPVAVQDIIHVLAEGNDELWN